MKYESSLFHHRICTAINFSTKIFLELKAPDIKTSPINFYTRSASNIFPVQRPARRARPCVQLNLLPHACPRVSARPPGPLLRRCRHTAGPLSRTFSTERVSLALPIHLR